MQILHSSAFVLTYPDFSKSSSIDISTQIIKFISCNCALNRPDFLLNSAVVAGTRRTIFLNSLIY